MQVEISNRHQKAINAARNEAMQVCDTVHRLGSVIVSGGKIVSSGRNSMRSKLGNQIVCTVHAEIAALRNLLKGREYEWHTDRINRFNCEYSANAVEPDCCLQGAL